MNEALRDVSYLSDDDLDHGRGTLEERALAQYRRLVTDNSERMRRVRTAGYKNQEFLSPLGDQWPDDVRKIYRQLSIPAKGINEVWPNVNAITGRETVDRFRPKWSARDSSSTEEQGLADAFNAAGERIRQRGGFDQVTSAVFRQAGTQRLGAARFWPDAYVRRTPDLKARRIRLDQVIVDLYASQVNLSDMTRVAHGRWMDLLEFRDFYPDEAAQELYLKLAKGGAGATADFSSQHRADQDIWTATLGSDEYGKDSLYWRRATNEIFVVEVEWREREARIEIEIPGEAAAAYLQMQPGKKRLEDEFERDRAGMEALQVLGFAVAEVQQQIDESVSQWQQQAQMAEQTGQEPPPAPELLPPIVRQLEGGAFAAFNTGYRAAGGGTFERYWNLRPEVYYAATIVGNKVVRVGRRLDRYWSILPLVMFIDDAEKGQEPYGIVDVLKPRQEWLNMFLAVWLSTMAHMPKAQVGIDADEVGGEMEAKRITREITSGSRAIWMRGGKNAIIQLPQGSMPDGIQQAWQMLLDLVPGGAGQSRYGVGSVDSLARTAFRLVEQQISAMNKVLAEAFDSLRAFRAAEATKIASMICAYYTVEDFRAVAGRYAKYVPEDRSLWWKFLDFNLHVSEEPATRDTATAVIEALNQTAMWEFYRDLDPESLVLLLKPLQGAEITERMLQAIRDQEPQRLMMKLEAAMGLEEGTIQGLLDEAQSPSPDEEVVAQ